MLAFKVTVNGVLRCTAGIDDFGVLSSILTRVTRDERIAPPGAEISDLTLSVSGFLSGEHGVDGEHLRWLEQELVVGDAITIEIVEVKEVDSPYDRYPHATTRGARERIRRRST